MPNINLQSLRGIPHINRAAMTQSNPNACGAYSLIGAIGAFGIFPTLRILSFVSIGPQATMKTAQIMLGNDYHALSLAIYGMTGVLNKKDSEAPPPVDPELLNDGNVYNSPAAMLSAIVGFEVFRPKIFAQSKGFAMIDELYPEAKTRWQGEVSDRNVVVEADAYTKPTATQTKIVCVYSKGKSFHWLAQGSDGNFYDPHNGKVNNLWQPKETGDAMGKYAFAGLWIEVNKA